MPTITLVAVPAEGATALDDVTGTTFVLDHPQFVEDPTVWERLQSLGSLGYQFEVVDNVEPAPDSEATDPAAEQAADPPAPQES